MTKTESFSVNKLVGEGLDPPLHPSILPEVLGRVKTLPYKILFEKR